MRALAPLLAIVVASLPLASNARAQAPDRGYGGPETVGPNFSTGKQSAPPDYGNGPPNQKSYSQPAPAKKAAKPSKPEVKAARKPEPKPATNSEPASTTTDAKDTAAEPAAATPPASGNDTPAAQPQTCRRFDATTGTTLEVPCR